MKVFVRVFVGIVLLVLIILSTRTAFSPTASTPESPAETTAPVAATLPTATALLTPTLTPSPTTTPSPTPSPTLTATATPTPTLMATPIPTTTVEVTTTRGTARDFLNIRTGPGTTYATLSTGGLKKGEKVEILSESAGTGCATWYQIRRSDGGEGWVCASFIRVDGAEDSDTTGEGELDEPLRPQDKMYTPTLLPMLQKATRKIPLALRFVPKEDDEVTQITPGVIHIRRVTDDPLKINILLFDITAPQFDVRPALGDGWLKGHTRTSTMATQNRALAAVNGDLFDGAGIPQGLTIINARVVMPPKHRATFAWTKDRKPFIGYFTDGWTWGTEVIAANGERRQVADLNRPCPEDQVCLYNEFVRVAPDVWGDIKVFLRPDGTVWRISEERKQRIESGIRVLYGSGEGADWLRENMVQDEPVELVIQTNHPLSNIRQAISGGPILLQRGKFVQDCLCKLFDCRAVTGEEESTEMLCEDFDTSWKESHYEWVQMPRTAIGFDVLQQTLIVVVVDGYQLGYSRGIRQDELADLMLEFGAYDAMELDGGGSTTMVLKDKIMNRPSDNTGERHIADSLLFFWKDIGERD